MAIKVCDWSEAISGAVDWLPSDRQLLCKGGCIEATVAAVYRGTALTVGSFDGPHVGHKAIFRCLVQTAAERGLVPGVVTFRRPLGALKVAMHPVVECFRGISRENVSTTAKGRPKPHDLSTLDERLECFEKCGIKMAVVVDFSADFARITGGEFFDLLREKLHCRFIAEGEDFHCGYGGAWGRREIAAYCAEHDIGCAFVPPVMMGGQRVSSSRIRAAIAAGDMEAARMMLG